jgi:FSR family fosmidomycin resistance protein-like MFS transporter
MSSIAATAETSPEKSFLEVWLISLGHTLTHWYPATFYLLLPLIGKELNLSYSEIGSILTAQFAAGALSNVPGGLLVDSVRRKGVLMAISLFWIGFPYLLMGFTHAYSMLLGCAALVGMGNNLWHPTAIPLLAHRFPERRGLVVSFHSMGGNVGDALAPLAAGALLTVFSWRHVVMLNLIPGVIMAVVLLVLLGRTAWGRPAGAQAAHQAEARAKPGAHEMLADIKELLRNRAVVLLSTSSAFRTMTQSALLTFLPVFLAGQMGYSPVWVGGCMFALQAAGFAAAPIAGHLSDRMGRRRIIMSSMAVSAAVLIFMALAGRSPAFVIFVAFLGFFLFAIRAVLQAWLLDAAPRHLGGTSIGIMFGSQSLGAAIGPIVGGLLADHYGLTATFYFLALTIVIANLFILWTPATVYAPARAAAGS